MRISVVAGDERNRRLNELLCADGWESELFEQSQPAQAADWGRIVVLPIKGVDPEVFNGCLNNEQTLVTGQDFLSRNDFAILNAIPTVEGAVQLAMEKTFQTLRGRKALVIGYGRIGKLLAHLLYGLGARVTVSARKSEDFAWIRAFGYKELNTVQLQGKLSGFDLIFNTVPHLVLPYMRLVELKQDCLVIDLASKPGGVDFKAAEKLGLNVEWALSLPGKVAPESAAIYMRDTLYAILRERGVSF